MNLLSMRSSSAELNKRKSLPNFKTLLHDKRLTSATPLLLIPSKESAERLITKSSNPSYTSRKSHQAYTEDGDIEGVIGLDK